MEVTCSSETSIGYRRTTRRISEDRILLELQFVSEVLLVRAEVDGLFTKISLENLSRKSDYSVLKYSEIYQVVTEGTDFSPPRPLPAEEDKQNFPFYFAVRQRNSLSKANESVISLKSTDE
jgi:hypothetical protein